MDLLERKIDKTVKRCMFKYGHRLPRHEFEKELLNIRFTKDDVPHIIKKYIKTAKIRPLGRFFILGKKR